MPGPPRAAHMRISNPLTDVATMDQHNAVLRVDEPPTLLGQRLGERRRSLRGPPTSPPS